MTSSNFRPDFRSSDSDTISQRHQHTRRFSSLMMPSLCCAGIFVGIDLILSFPGVCYQFPSLFTVRGCVLQLYDTQCSISVILCACVSVCVCRGGGGYWDGLGIWQISLSCISSQSWVSTHNRGAVRSESSSELGEGMDIIAAFWWGAFSECLALTFWKCLTFNSIGSKCTCSFYSVITSTWLAAGYMNMVMMIFGLRANKERWGCWIRKTPFIAVTWKKSLFCSP